MKGHPAILEGNVDLRQVKHTLFWIRFDHTSILRTTVVNAEVDDKYQVYFLLHTDLFLPIWYGAMYSTCLLVPADKHACAY